MGNKQECAKEPSQMPTTKPLSRCNSAPVPQRNNGSNCNNINVLVAHNKQRHHKQSLTNSTSPCSPLSELSAPHCCDHRRAPRMTISAPNNLMNQSLSHIDIKKSHSLHSLPMEPVEKLSITPSPSPSPYSSLHLQVPHISINGARKLPKRSWSEHSMTNPYSLNEDESDTESASTPWILYRTAPEKKPTLSLEQIHHDEVMLSEPPSPSESIRSFEFYSCHKMSALPKKSSTSDLVVESVDIN